MALKLNLFLNSAFIALYLLLLPTHGQRISEFMASNASSLSEPESYAFSDWIEIHNPGPDTVDMGSLYLSDSFKDLLKWQFPPGTVLAPDSFLIVWADGSDTLLHTGFKLSSAGEVLILSSGDSAILDSISYGPQLPDISFGRTSGASPVWAFFGFPTPGAPNPPEGVENPKDRARTPVFSSQGGFYYGPVSLRLEGAPPGAHIRYSTDGTVPSVKTRKYISAIVLDSTTVVRARVIQDGFLPGDVITNTYFIADRNTLPVISLTTDPENLWDPENGIYVEGTNGIPGWGGIVGNFNQDWEKRFSFEYFDETGRRFLQQDVGVKLMGAVIRLGQQKAFSVFPRGKYGSGSLDYPFFPNRKISSYRSIILRNSGNDQEFSFIRDGMMQLAAAATMDIDYQEWRPVSVYLNGKYWGLYHIREKQNEDYLAALHGADPARVAILEGFPHTAAAESAGYMDMFRYMQDNDMTRDSVFEHVETLMDMEEFIDYHILEVFCANLDWPAGNIKYWHGGTGGSRWRWMVFDMDYGFGLSAQADFNTLAHATSDVETSWSNPTWATFMLRSLLLNENFKNRFLQRMAGHLNITFEPGRVHGLIDSMAALLVPEMPRHIMRWGTDTTLFTAYWRAIPSMEAWRGCLDSLKRFADQRPGYVWKNLREKFPYDTVRLTIRAPEGRGDVYIDGLKVPSLPWSGRYFGKMPLPVRAAAAPGFRFAGWKELPDSLSGAITLSLSENTALTPLFLSPEDSVLPLRISADLVLTEAGSPYLLTGPMTVEPGAALMLGPGVLVRIAPEADILIAGNIIAEGLPGRPVTFECRQKGKKWGALILKNAARRSVLKGMVIKDASVGHDPFNFRAAVSGFGSDVTMEDVRIEGDDQPVFIQYGDAVIRKCIFRMTKTGDLINVKYGTAVVDSCDLMGNRAADTDAIDYDEISGGWILNNRIYEFSGFNSDGIDLGEGTSGVVVQGNMIYNCNDKGISVGQASTAVIRGNIIIGCASGVAVKDYGSHALIDRNTFYGNGRAVTCFEKTFGMGGGTAEVINTLFHLSDTADVEYDGLSDIRVTWSLSSRGPLPGRGNLFSNPQFLPGPSLSFQLSDNSPAVDAGSPDSEKDPDNTRADIGAFPLSRGLFKVKITEIHCSSPSGMKTGDWIELFNPASDTADLTGWTFRTGGSDKPFRFSPGTVIAPGMYAVLCSHAPGFLLAYPNVSVAGRFRFDIPREGETLVLADAQGNIADSLSFTSAMPWPSIAAHKGGAIGLRDLWSDNALPENWSVSTGFGTPGSANIFSRWNPSVVINEISYNQPLAFNTFDWLEILNNKDEDADLSGWTLSDGDPTHIFRFRHGTILDPGGYLVICSEPDSFARFFPEAGNIGGRMDFGLSGKGETIRLTDAAGNPADEVTYGDNAPWPLEADGWGPTLELIHPLLDNTLPRSWAASDSAGTPGRRNSRWSEEQVPAGIDTSFPAAKTTLLQNYPNPVSNETIIAFSLEEGPPAGVFMELVDYQGARAAVILNKTFLPGIHQVRFSAGGLRSGIYFYVLKTGTGRFVRKMVVTR